jgi:hypothetical protein
MTKTVTYTAEQTAELVSAYVASANAETVATFAEKFGKSVKSIVAKLAREGVYKSAAKEKAASTTTRKDEIVIALELMVGAELKSFENATKKDLEVLLAFIKREGQ